MPAEASTYYLATYLRCFFFADSDGRESLMDAVYYFLRRCMNREPGTRLSLPQAEAVGQFLEIAAREYRHAYEPEMLHILNDWKDHVRSLT